MSRWLALAERAAENIQTPPDNMTKPDKTPSTQPEDAFCQVLSNCQTGEGSERPATKSSTKTDDMRHGFALGEMQSPKTWTGKIVSLADWRQLSEWEKHGPNGWHWNGITKQWEWPK